MACAVLLTGLTLVALAFGRHLAATQLLQDSLTASAWADQRLMEEALHRRLEVQWTENAPVQSGFTAEQIFNSNRLAQDPVKDLVMDQATAQVSWTRRSQQRSAQITAGFAPKASGSAS